MAGGDTSQLGVYVMPGPATDTHSAEPQAVEAERLGMGSVWFSELQGPMKDAGAVLGYIAHATKQIRIGTSVSHFGTRHPMVQASWGATMQVLTGGHFAMGFGRSVPDRWRAWGIPVPTSASMGDFAEILRRLWRGETVAYDGPAGRYPHLHLGEFPSFTPPPLYLAAIGPKTLEVVGRSFDGVLLHPFTTLDGLARARTIVRDAAERAGRDADGLRIIGQVVTAPDLTEDELNMVVRARIAAYLSHPGFGELMAAANGWDTAPIEALRAEAKKVADHSKGLGESASGRAILVGPSRVIPDKWLAESAAVGTASQCAKILSQFLDAGADELVIHGSTADKLERTVKAFSVT
jgi:probable F420-dependent oxidoreductase